MHIAFVLSHLISLSLSTQQNVRSALTNEDELFANGCRGLHHIVVLSLCFVFFEAAFSIFHFAYFAIGSCVFVVDYFCSPSIIEQIVW